MEAAVPYTLPGLPDNYEYDIIQTDTPGPKPLLNAQPLRIAQASLSDVPMPVWILLGLLVVGVVGILALAMTKK